MKKEQNQKPDTTGKPMKKKKKKNKQPIPLSEAVGQSMAAYFEELDGHKPADLYSFVLKEVEPPLLRAVLDYTDQNQSQASEILGLNRGTLRKKLKQYDLI